MKRIVAIIGMAALSVAGFFGCSYLNEAMAPKGFDPATVPDVVEYAAGIPAETVVARVDGEPILAEDYLYWMGYTVEMLQYYQGGAELDWTEDMEGMTLADVVKTQSLETAKLYRVVETLAREAGCAMDAEDEAHYQAGLETMVEQLGGEAAFDKWLLEIGLTKNGYHKVNEVQYLHENLEEKVAGEVALTEEEKAEYVEENDILRAKHILLMTQDRTTGETYSEEKKAEVLAQAEGLVAQLRESEDPISLFDRLMHEYSEDGGLAAYPDGYDFTAGEMVEPFEQGTRGLAIGEISGVVESTYGYHIILRLDPVESPTYWESVRAELARTELTERLNTALEEAQVELTEAYDALDVAAYTANLSNLREEIAMADAAAEAEEN